MPSTRMTEAEWQTRVDLAACYRLVDLFGWSDLINTRITARVPGQDDHFLINPYGLRFDEITASSLVKINADGNKVEPSDAEITAAGSRCRARCIRRGRKLLACSTPIRLPGAPCRCKGTGCCRPINMPSR
jgi:Class II Aldolase and Adducin N-terminal domain